jgi:uncharacterized coiled-coil DUF342 family protein
MSVPRRAMEKFQKLVNEFLLAYVDTHGTFMEVADTVLKDGYRLAEINKQVTSLNSAQQTQPLELKIELLKESGRLEKELAESDRRLAQVSKTISDLEAFREWTYLVLTTDDGPTSNSIKSMADVMARIDALEVKIHTLREDLEGLADETQRHRDELQTGMEYLEARQPGAALQDRTRTHNP